MAYSNINQYVNSNLFPKLKLELYDMSLTSDETGFNQEVVFSPYLIAQTYGNKLPIYFDINYSGSCQIQTLTYGEYNLNNVLISKNFYNINNDDLNCMTSTTVCDIGLTGIDNGLVNSITGESITFTNGVLSDEVMFNRLSYDKKLKLFQITGYTSQNSSFSGFDKTVLYEIVSKSVPYGGHYHDLYGGFYQGFYKLFGYDYEIFPERVNKGWTVEMILKPRLIDEYFPSTGQTTLNEIYPENKNTFFYFGTRAENKFYHYASGNPKCYTGYTRVTEGMENFETCACCNRNITNSRCLFVYPQRSKDGVHDSHLSYGCPVCNGDVNKSVQVNCGCDCHNNPCETCGWECKTHICESEVELTPTPTPTPSSTTTLCMTTTPLCTPTCSTHTPDCPVCEQCYTGFTSIENTCETDPLYDSISNSMSFRLSGDVKNPKICVKVLRFTGDCVTTGTCSTTGITYSTGYTINEYCSTNRIYDYCELINAYFLEQEHWFQFNAVWERYTWFETCNLKYKGGLDNITKKEFLESLVNNSQSLITVPYTEVGGKIPEKIEIVNLNERWLIDKKYRKGKLKFYVNGKLFHTIEDFEEIIPRALNTEKEKQLGVPFNISWGGGTQGLRENLTGLSSPFFQDPECLPNSDLSGTTLSGLSTNILIEQNFAGSFDGGISQFRMYVEPLSSPEIKHNFKINNPFFGMFNPDCPDCFIYPCETDDFSYEIE